MSIEHEIIAEEILALKVALREAILKTGRVSKKCIEADPAGCTYDIDWLPEVKEWAKLADLNLEKHNPSFYVR